MKNERGSTVRIRMLVLTVLALVGAACSAVSEDLSGDGATTGSTTQAAVADETVSTDRPGAPPEEAPDAGSGDFLVLMVANVDELTAAGTLESLEEADFEGFVMDGSAEEGFDVYNPGLTNDEALELLTEIFSAPGVNGGLIFETVNLP